jgi:prepilin-type N-terminal cleavage/methylation domain-containing protein
MMHQAARKCLPKVAGSRRLGYTLIEVLVAVGIVSMLMTAAAVALQTMYRVDRQLKDNMAYGQVSPRLSLQLRIDVHSATDITMLEGPNETDGLSLTLATTGERIEYRSEVGRIVRTRRLEEKVLGREVYYLGKTATFRWTKTSHPSPRVELEIVRLMGKIDSADARQVDRVVAAIGIRNRYEEEGVADASNE